MATPTPTPHRLSEQRPEARVGPVWTPQPEVPATTCPSHQCSCAPPPRLPCVPAPADPRARLLPALRSPAGDCGQVTAPSCFSTSFWERGQWDLLPRVTGGLNGPISAEACRAPLFTTGARTVITSASPLSWPKPNSKPVHCEASSRSLCPSSPSTLPLALSSHLPCPRPRGPPAQIHRHLLISS